jgi:beta-ribofuranosylaminobenzene 5'-phosphate synthase
VLRGPASATTNVTVAVPARLHLGFLDLNGSLGRRFGSLGLPVSGLRTSISVQPAAQTRVRGPEAERVRRHVDVMQRLLDLAPGYDLRIDEVVPSHAGLGSGTQLALAVAAALRRLHGLPLDLRGDAIRLGRGLRSGVGIGLFEYGGFVVDGGRGDGPGPAPIISRLPFPEAWRVLVVLDPERRGLYGPDESEAFAQLPPVPAAQAAHLCRLLVMQILPALAEADLARFGAGIEELQAAIGEHFAPAQGGHRFTSPAVAAALAWLEREGALGIGQSSWGPTGFAFVPSAERARRLVEAARRHAAGAAVDIRVCQGLNTGAEIMTRATADAPES